MSSILSKEALNDFITPSQVCINPVKNEPVKQQNDVFEVGKEDDVPTKVNITLQDCLACSGCVTTSEELLLEQHSYETFFQKYSETLKDDADTTLLVSISPTCRLSLLNYLKFSSLDEVDMWFLRACEDLFAEKKNQNKLFVTSTQIGKEISNREMLASVFEKKDVSSDEPRKPLLTAVCPGVVLYIEKQHNILTSNFIKIKPEMSALGQLLKRKFAEKDSNASEKQNNVFHLSVMPCFDKKLESSKIADADVDCVLTPKEIINMLIDKGVSLKSSGENVPNGQLLDPYGNKELAGLAWRIDGDEIEAGNSSGGYAFKYIKEKQKRILASENISSEIVREEGKNSDMVFYKLTSKDGDHVLASSCELYGFKNLQNLIRKLDSGSKKHPFSSTKKPLFKSRKRLVTGQTADNKHPLDPSECDFIELMACPGGCINGGGLLTDSENSNSKKRYESIGVLNALFLSEFSSPAKQFPALASSHVTLSDRVVGLLSSDTHMPALFDLSLAYTIDMKAETDTKDDSTALFEQW